jgi:hypothetical protein
MIGRENLVLTLDMMTGLLEKMVVPLERPLELVDQSQAHNQLVKDPKDMQSARSTHQQVGFVHCSPFTSATGLPERTASMGP